jgi:hypothetical protein
MADSLSRKQSDEISRRVFEALGEASMCWSETPTGIFDSTHAKTVGDNLVAFIESHVDRLNEDIEIAWGIIANAGGGDWDREGAEWKKAAERWRDERYIRDPNLTQSSRD